MNGEELEQIRFRDLSLPLKIAVVLGYISGIFYAIAVLIALIQSMIGPAIP
jgi:hypothetical protein